jgi:hypothetical protein
MRRINLDDAPPAVKKYIRSLRVGPGGVNLESQGEVILRVLPPNEMTEAEKAAAVDKAWKLIRRSQERNRGVSQAVIAREVQDAVDEVRRRRRK